MTSFSSRLPAIAVGAGVLMAVGFGLCGDNKTSLEDPSDPLKDCPNLRADVSVAASLRELSQLFKRVDETRYQELVQALEELLGLQLAPPTTARVGQLNVARALRAKRRASVALDDLRKEARARFPGQAIEAVEDEKTIIKAIGDALHNIQLISGLITTAETTSYTWECRRS